jgi:archaellin
MERALKGQDGVVKVGLNNYTKEQLESINKIVDFHQKVLETGGAIFGQAVDLSKTIIDFKDKEQDRKVRMAIYADKSKKWDEAFNEIKKNNERNYELLSKVFKDRRDTIDKAFEIIDHGLKENNMEVVLGAFGEMAKMVAQSPLAQAASAAHKLFESGDISKLDPV